MKDLEHAAFSLLTPVPRADAASMHPMSLAFVGDAVQSLYMRIVYEFYCVISVKCKHGYVLIFHYLFFLNVFLIRYVF